MTDLIVGDAARSAPPQPAKPARTSPPGPGSRWSDGSGSPRRPASEDRLGPYAPAILAVRWATTGVSIALASPELLTVGPTIIGWVCLIFVNTVFRTVRPLRYTGSTRSRLVLGVEIGFHVLAVVTTGYWDSALVLLLINAVIIAGFARGFGFALKVGIASTLAVSGAGLRAETWTAEQAAQAAQWTTLLLSGGLIAGYTRRISGEANRRHDLALDRVARLADANSLLTNLHRVAQTLPASLDLADVLDSTLVRLRGLIDHDTAVIMTKEADGSWSVADQRGLGLPGHLEDDQVPAPARRCMATVRIARLETGERGFGERAVAGVYLPLLARGRLIGLLGVESRTDGHFSDRDEQVLLGFVEPVALAIDNARLFDRIRTIGANEERNRIARDLHDRIGQSLAYLGVEIDRLIRRDADGEANGENLEALRDDLRTVIGEVRDTLSDLRTDVSDAKDFAETAYDFSRRVAERSGLSITLDCDTDHRLPLLQEREMWRIAQEALVNVERHANATEASVLWRCDEDGSLLEVVDNGCGLPDRSADGRLGRADSYGIVGMRERADSVGATLEMTSTPGEGTRVRCFLPHQ